MGEDEEKKDSPGRRRRRRMVKYGWCATIAAELNTHTHNIHMHTNANTLIASYRHWPIDKTEECERERESEHNTTNQGKESERDGKPHQTDDDRWCGRWCWWLCDGLVSVNVEQSLAWHSRICSLHLLTWNHTQLRHMRTRVRVNSKWMCNMWFVPNVDHPKKLPSKRKQKKRLEFEMNTRSHTMVSRQRCSTQPTSKFTQKPQYKLNK